MLTPGQYAECEGLNCPVCESPDIGTDGGVNTTVSGFFTYQRCGCNSCGATWNDMYQLVGYNNLEEGDRDGN